MDAPPPTASELLGVVDTPPAPAPAPAAAAPGAFWAQFGQLAEASGGEAAAESAAAEDDAPPAPGATSGAASPVLAPRAPTPPPPAAAPTAFDLLEAAAPPPPRPRPRPHPAPPLDAAAFGAPPPLAADSVAPFAPGTVVTIVGLKAKPELNGASATVLGWDGAKGRSNVSVVGSGAVLALKAANLQRGGGGTPPPPAPAEVAPPPPHRRRRCRRRWRTRRRRWRASRRCSTGSA